MKKYPPRTHNKKNRVNREWKKWLGVMPIIQKERKPFRERKGVTTLIRPE